MTTNDPRELDRARALMMAALDDEITPGDRHELERMAAQSPAIQAEWRRMARVKEVTNGMTLRDLPQETWDQYWVSVYSRAERGLAWALVSAGAIVLMAYGLWHAVGALAGDRTIPVAIRIGLAALLTGGAILLFSVLRERLTMWRKDPYSREVIR